MSGVVHSIKRAVIGSSAAKKEPTDPYYQEYDILKSKLADTRVGLDAGIADVKASELKWTLMMKETGDFYSKLHDKYPRHDSVKTRIDHAVRTMQGPANDRKSRLIDPSSESSKLLDNVRLYIAHIKGIEETYPSVEQSYKDFAMYHQKVDKLHDKDAPDEKQSSNVEKLETAKTSYEALIQSTVKRQQAAELLAPEMYNSLLLCHSKIASGMNSILQEELADLYTYANTPTDIATGTGHMNITSVSKTGSIVDSTGHGHGVHSHTPGLNTHTPGVTSYTPSSTTHTTIPGHATGSTTIDPTTNASRIWLPYDSSKRHWYILFFDYRINLACCVVPPWTVSVYYSCNVIEDLCRVWFTCFRAKRGRQIDCCC